MPSRKPWGDAADIQPVAATSFRKAIKFTTRGGRVAVTLHVAADVGLSSRLLMMVRGCHPICGTKSSNALAGEGSTHESTCLGLGAGDRKDIVEPRRCDRGRVGPETGATFRVRLPYRLKSTA
jgi:hypothetical protein